MTLLWRSLASTNFPPWKGLFLLSLGWHICIAIQSIPYVVVFGGSDKHLSYLVGSAHLAAYALLAVCYVFVESYINYVHIRVAIVLLQAMCATLLVFEVLNNDMLIASWSFLFTLDAVVNTVKMQTMAMVSSEEIVYESILASHTVAYSIVWSSVGVLYLVDVLPTSVVVTTVQNTLVLTFVVKLILMSCQLVWFPDTVGNKFKDLYTLSCRKGLEKIKRNFKVVTMNPRMIIFTFILPFVMAPAMMIYNSWISFYFHPKEENREEITVLVICGGFLPLFLVLMTWLNEEFQSHIHLVVLFLITVTGWVYVLFDYPLYLIGITTGIASFLVRFIKNTWIIAMMQRAYNVYIPGESLSLVLFVMHAITTGAWHAYVILMQHTDTSATTRSTGLIASITAVFILHVVAYMIKRWTHDTMSDHGGSITTSASAEL